VKTNRIARELMADRAYVFPELAILELLRKAESDRTKIKPAIKGKSK